MTIQEVIKRIKHDEPNFAPETEIIDWLSVLDQQVWREIILTHEGKPEGTDFKGYNEGTDQQTELLIPAPDDAEIYLNYVEANIHKLNGEMGKYNQSVVMYNSAYNNYANYYNRTHMPIARAHKFDF